MPLSEEELRLLEQMERALAEEDPRFASALQGRTLVRAARLKIAIAVVGFVAGGSAVGVGMWQRMIWLGIVGFVVMTLAAAAGLSQWRSHRFVSALGATPLAVEEDFGGLRVIQGGKAARPRNRRGTPIGRRYAAWLNRLEARWLHRRDQNL